MNILISTNSKFVPMVLAMLTSLFQSNSKAFFNIYLFYSDLTNRDIHRLNKFIIGAGHKFKDIKINKEYFINIPTTEHLSIETYFRLFAPIFLPEDVDRILYLDGDILVTGSIDELYHTELENYFFAGAKDTSNKIELVKENLGIPRRYTYINAGILLMNIRLMRKEYKLEEALTYAKKNQDIIPNCDQDVINALYFNKIKLVSNKFNYEARFHTIEEILDYPVFLLKNRFKQDIIIIHYMGRYKPWNRGYGGKFGILYYKQVRKMSLNKYSTFNIFTWWFYVFKQLNL